MVESDYRNVCDVIVSNDLCIGCGICAGICPTNALKIEWNKYGEYIPLEQNSKCTECGLCLQVCPFWNQEENESTLAERQFRHQDGIRHNPITGLYLKIFVGYSKVDDHRTHGAAGGLTTWLLETMFSQKMADHICCILPNSDPDKLFLYSIVNSIPDIRRASGSAYYPVELSRVISEILSIDGNYAIVGLPCTLKAIRLAMLRNEVLRKRIVVLVGLVCGQQKSKFFAEYLCAMGGGNPSKLKSARFRVKDITRNVLDHRFEFSWEDDEGIKNSRLYQAEGMDRIWGYDYFKPNACNFCDDICAEVADVVFCDAVHKNFTYGSLGSNFVLVRSIPIIDILLKGLSNDEIFLRPVPLKSFLERQNGVNRLKRNDLQHRLYLQHQNTRGGYILSKRFVPKQYKDARARNLLELREKMRVLSRSAYTERRYKSDIVNFVEEIIRPVSMRYERRTLIIKFYDKLVQLIKIN